MVILTLDTTTRAGSCAVWRGDGVVDEQVGNPEHTHAQRLPNDLAKILASHRLRLQDVTLYAIASGPGSFTGLRVGIATVQSLALVHDRLIVPISSLEALSYCAAREDPIHARPGTYVGAWMEAYRGEVFCALYRVLRTPTLIESTDPDAGIQLPKKVPLQIMPLPVAPAKTRMSLAHLDLIAEPAVGTPDAMIERWAEILGAYARIQIAMNGPPLPPPTLILMGDAVHANRPALLAQFPRTTLLDHVPIAGMIAEIAAREPHRGIVPHAVMPLYLRRPIAELARERMQEQLDEQAAAEAPPPDWRRQGSGNGSGNGSSNGFHMPVQ